MKTTQHDWLERLATAAAIIALPLAAAAHGLPHEAPDQCAPAPHTLRGPMPLPPPDMRLDGHAPGGMPLPPYLRDIELSEAQQDKLFDLIHAHAPAVREKGKAAVKAMEELRRLATADRFDAAQARTIANTHAMALADLAMMHAEIDAQVRALLTPEQRKRIDDTRTKTESRFGCSAKHS